MRPKLNKVFWKVVHLDIVLYLDYKVAASSDIATSEQFLSQVADFLMSQGYKPRRPIEEMKQSFKSPYSTSEYYTFLKVDNSHRIKIVLDIRLADHSLKEWGNHSARERHLRWMEDQLVPELEKEFSADGSDSTNDMYDVIETHSPVVDVISVDGELFDNYNDALLEVKQRVTTLS